MQVTDGCSHMASQHTCDTRVGNSGSPLFEVNGSERSKWLVRAVHFAGLQDASYNLAIPIDDNLFQWMECYRSAEPSCAPSDFLVPL